MPAKGDNFDAIIASALTEHQSNVCFVYTPPGATHPNSGSIHGRGSFSSTYVDVAEGFAAHGPPYIDVESRIFCDGLKIMGVFTIVDRGDYKVEQIEPSARGRTRIQLSQFRSAGA